MSSMILFELIKNFVIKAAVTVLSLFINEFIDWLKKVPELIAEKIEGVLIGCKTFVNKKIDQYGNMTERSDNYSYNKGKWFITSATRSVDERDIPDEILNRSSDMDIEVTNELLLELE